MNQNFSKNPDKQFDELTPIQIARLFYKTKKIKQKKKLGG